MSVTVYRLITFASTCTQYSKYIIYAQYWDNLILHPKALSLDSTYGAVRYGTVRSTRKNFTKKRCFGF